MITFKTLIAYFLGNRILSPGMSFTKRIDYWSTYKNYSLLITFYIMN